MLVLSRLVLGDITHLPTAAAATHEPPVGQMIMMGGVPCSGMMEMSAEHGHQPLQGNDGSCCKASQCACLHAPALSAALHIPVLLVGRSTETACTAVHLIGDPAAVFFRPPI